MINVLFYSFLRRTERQVFLLFLLFNLVTFGTSTRARADHYTDSLTKAFSSHSGSERLKFETAEHLVRAFLNSHKPDLANYYLQKAFRLSADIEDIGLQAKSYYLQGKLYIFLLDYDNAMFSFIEADKLFRQQGMMKDHGLAEMQFGILMYTQNNYQAAIDFFLKGYQVLNREKDTLSALTCNYLMGLSLLELGRYKESEEVLNKSLLQSEKYGFMQREVECRLGLANLYVKTGDYERALANASIALDYYRLNEQENSNNQGGKSRAEYIYGLAAMGSGKYALAKEMLENASKHARLSGRYVECIKIAEALIGFYKKTKDFNRAMEQVSYMLTLKDSLVKTEASKSLRVFQDRQNIQKQNAKIELLTAQQEKDKVLQVSLISLSVLLSILALMWYQKFRFKQETNKRLDELLYNILPEEVAEEMKAKGSTASRSYNTVTVLFVDMVAFTKLSEKLSPSELVAELHYCFSEFDKISSKYNLEKIKTLGDAYMCAGGVPVSNETHAFDAIHASLDILEFMRQYNETKKEELKIQLRIGIHSGPVVAGIVGLKKFAYDIWGDTVNIAARMEQAGEPGRINISESTYQLVKDHFKCNNRGKINAKYKGEINMYFVEPAETKPFLIPEESPAV